MPHICPDCSIELTHKVLDGVPYEECQQCAGIWLTEVALKCLEDKGPEELEQMEQENRPTRLVQHNQSRVCPECKRPMQRFMAPGNPPVELDQCDMCYGLWIDDGELDRIAQALRPAPPSASQQHLDADVVLAQFTAEHNREMARCQAVSALCRGMVYRPRYGTWLFSRGWL